MAKTVDAVLFDAQAWLKRAVVTTRVGRPDLKPLLAEAFQDVYEMARMNDPSAFAKSVAFSGASIDLTSLASDFREEILVEIPTAGNAGCVAGAAREATQRNYDNMQGVTTIAGTTADPLYLLNATTITVSPAATAGTLYYYPKYDDTLLGVDTTDLETLLPRPYIQDITLGLISLAIIRLDLQVNPNALNSLRSKIERVRKSKEILNEARKAANLAATDTQAPAPLQARASQGGLLGN